MLFEPCIDFRRGYRSLLALVVGSKFDLVIPLAAVVSTTNLFSSALEFCIPAGAAAIDVGGLTDLVHV